MPDTKSKTKSNLLSIFGACMGWLAVIGQFILIIINRQADILETTIRFFSYFTILTNILVSLYFTSQIFNLKTFKFLKNDSALTPITAFILIVGLVYQVVLRWIWQPTGSQMIIDELLHTVMPVYLLVYWFFYVNASYLKPRNLFAWLLYPFMYFIFIMIRGYFSGFYPYPFIDVSSIGYPKVFFNFMMLSVVVLVLMGILHVLARFLKRQLLKP
ncbi:Pr6Pr family membrane protein [Arenibacter algicola]|uniref:Pr6Pr family membrane protein n=1 Tax=Arenibacter algicola TaxID=616991 RepID=UPI001C07D884|nr:Pr6Pr family membrane protein [Arenibacter algicola]MBU2903617.1 Pr6Pr family membrane protein [Arenibacter algicola]